MASTADVTEARNLWPVGLPPARGRWLAAAVAVALHAALGAAIIAVNPARFRTEQPVEIDVQEQLPPPEIKPPAPEPPPPPPEPRPRVVVRHAPAPRVPPPPAEAPPPPSAEPPKTENAPPTFGVSMDSVVAGNESGMAVPVGNTLMGKPKSGPPGGPVHGYSSEGTHPFTPVADIYIGTYPEKTFEVNSDEIYPPEAKRMGIEGAVKAKIGIDETGKVVEVKIVERAGHGFDEAALKAMWKLRFKPAKTTDGRSVPFRIDYTYNFNLTQ